MKIMRTTLLSVCISLCLTPAFAANTLNDSQISNIILAIDHNEMGTAKTMLALHPSHVIKKYAHMIYHQHKHNAYKLTKLVKTLKLTAESSKQYVAITDQGKAESKSLHDLDVKKASDMYINDAISGHRGGLKLIDTTLLKDVKSPKLKAFVEKTRVMVHSHLVKALKLKKKYMM